MNSLLTTDNLSPIFTLDKSTGTPKLKYTKLGNRLKEDGDKVRGPTKQYVRFVNHFIIKGSEITTDRTGSGMNFDKVIRGHLPPFKLNGEPLNGNYVLSIQSCQYEGDETIGHVDFVNTYTYHSAVFKSTGYPISKERSCPCRLQDGIIVYESGLNSSNFVLLERSAEGLSGISTQLRMILTTNNEFSICTVDRGFYETVHASIVIGLEEYV